MATREYLIEELTSAYMACRKNKRNKESSLQFEMNWASNVCSLADELMERTYEIGKSITFIVTRPKWREVFAADFRDRVIHHYIVGKLEPLFEEVFIDDTYNCRKGKGTLYGAKRVHRMVYECSNGYTEDCWIAKFDMQGFFMSIHKPTLWAMLERFIKERYHGEDKELILWLTEKVVMNSPEKNCVRHSPEWMWSKIPNDKSLFTVGDDYGLPIGNITSQMFANFYLSNFDDLMKNMFCHYGRYVDDFVVIDKDKKKILSFIPTMKDELAKIHVTLHPKKMYIQHYTKGVSFVGVVSKIGRTYIGNRTSFNFMNTVTKCNGVVDKEAYLSRFVMRINSYLGYMIHHDSYAIRRKIIGMMDRDWYRYLFVKGHFQSVRAKAKYSEKSRIIGLIA